MERRSSKWAHFFVPLILVLLLAGEAHAQRVPQEFIWFAGASLFAPFVAIPVKLGILRLLNLGPGCSRLWPISAIEWAIWFPVAFLLFRSGNQSSFALIVLFLFAAAMGLCVAQDAARALAVPRKMRRVGLWVDMCW